MTTARLPIGPAPTSTSGAQSTLNTLWQVAGAAPPRYDTDLLVVTERAHLGRVLEALDPLGADAAGRQAVVVRDAPGTEGQASLVGGKGPYVERVVVPGGAEDLGDLAARLLHDGTETRVWWACEAPPPRDVLERLARRALQVVLDAELVPDGPPLPCGVADLAWARTVRWRVLADGLLGTPDLARRLGEMEHATVRFAGADARPARLFAAWLAARLGWADLARLHLAPVAEARERGDLAGFETVGAGASLLAEAHGDVVRVDVAVDGIAGGFARPLPPLTLGQGLAEVLRRPARDPEYDRAVARLAASGG